MNLSFGMTASSPSEQVQPTLTLPQLELLMCPSHSLSRGPILHSILVTPTAPTLVVSSSKGLPRHHLLGGSCPPAPTMDKTALAQPLLLKFSWVLIPSLALQL